MNNNCTKSLVKKMAIIFIVFAIVFTLFSCPNPDTEIDTVERIAITNTAQWNSAISKIKSGGNGKNYVLTITGNVAVPPSSYDSPTFGTVDNLTVTLEGNGTLSPNANGSIFSLNDALSLSTVKQTLVITGPVTLKGRNMSDNGEDNTDSVVAVYNNAVLDMRNGTITGNATGMGGGVAIIRAIFTMSGGKISGNTASDWGGGVGTYASSFTMSGGEISGNTAGAAPYDEDCGGGGVNVYSGSFTMSGGTISGNTAFGGGYGGDGGGVFLMDDGGVTFTKTGGIIYGSNADSIKKNTALNGDTEGHAVFYSASGQYYYCNTTLNTGDNISTAIVPTQTGSDNTVGNWIKR